MPDQNHFRINAIAFKEGDAWVKLNTISLRMLMT
jgi:hypothetical protein